MAAASRSLATALWKARFASGLLRRSYTTTWDATRNIERIATKKYITPTTTA
jgi:ribosomal protein L33